ncbi:unnamed protein product, partial [Closterium sp. NIES-54]
FDASLCPTTCPRPCERVCPAAAIRFLPAAADAGLTAAQASMAGSSSSSSSSSDGVIAERCYGCGRCIPVCPLGLICTSVLAYPITFYCNGWHAAFTCASRTAL